ncbi:hypothetical protein [Polaromonas sp. JS666]|nr:hypothetical protein [Polaromonas sp. JS666]
MCYSAQVWADYRRYIRDFGAELDIREFYEPVTYQSVIKGLSSPSSSE